MQHKHLRFGTGFRVLMGYKESQVVCGTGADVRCWQAGVRIGIEWSGLCVSAGLG